MGIVGGLGALAALRGDGGDTGGAVKINAFILMNFIHIAVVSSPFRPGHSESTVIHVSPHASSGSAL